MEFIDERLNTYAEQHTSSRKRFIKRPKPTNASKNIATKNALWTYSRALMLSMFSQMIHPKCAF
jgi:hypothetical protein